MAIDPDLTPILVQMQAEIDALKAMPASSVSMMDSAQIAFYADLYVKLGPLTSSARASIFDSLRAMLATL